MYTGWYGGRLKLLPVALPILLLTACSFAPDTPLQFAASHNDVTAIEALLERGANVNERGAHGITPIASAARCGALGAICSLAKHGAGTNLRSGVNGWTPLQHAIHKHQLESVRALLDRGADVNGRGQDGATALMMASAYGYTGIVQLLLDRGADAYAHLEDGTNALSWAVLGAPDIDRFTIGDCQAPTVRLLVQRAPGLKLTSGGDWILRPLAVAKLKGCAGLVDMLPAKR